VDEVLELAEKLSKAIARSTRFTDLRVAEKGVMENEEAIAILKTREEAAIAVSKKEQAGEPIEPDEKHALMASEEKIRGNPALTELSRTQADFQEMLNLVNVSITSAIRPEPPKEEKPPEAEEPEPDPAE
jgi:cell fate (sporulation/competence/biofilm development) regulator YlbF (YheA/YmcA/DUF963 family)